VAVAVTQPLPQAVKDFIAAARVCRIATARRNGEPHVISVCLSLASPSWAEEVGAGLERRAPRPPDEVRSRYVWTLHRSYGGTSNSVAVEVRPRFGELMYWRFAVPAEAAKPAWGYGPSGGGALSAVMTSAVEGTGEIAGVPIMWFGAGDRLSPGTSAYAVFPGEPPSRVFFGCAPGPYGFPGEWEGMQLGQQR
jgi:hypothetical protein